MLINRSIMALLATATQACLQTEVTSIRNVGKITDYLTGSDEMHFMFGVSSLFYYEYEKQYKEDETVAIPSKKVYFPCFESEAMWIEVQEIDDAERDRTQVSLDCINL
jgi:hypothetical protein